MALLRPTRTTHQVSSIIHRPVPMMSESCAAPPWYVSSLSFLSYSQRSPCSLWVFISRLKMFTFLASLVAAGSLFQLFTTLWLKNVLWPLFSLSLLLSGSCHSFRVLCCHLKPHILAHFVHLRNNFVRLYHVHCSCPLFSFPMSPVLSLCIFLHMCVLSDLISFFTACCCTLSKTRFSSAIHGAHTGAANSTCGSMYCT